MDIFADIIGVIGTILIVISYFLLQKGTMQGNDWSYLWLNLSGAILLLFSLYYKPNLGSIVIEFFWIGISIYGMAKKITPKKKASG